MFVDVGEREVGVVDHEGTSIFRVLKGTSESYQVSVSKRRTQIVSLRIRAQYFVPR